MAKCKYCKELLFLGPATLNWYIEKPNEKGLSYYCTKREKTDPFTYPDHVLQTNLEYLLEKYEELTKK